MLDFNLRQVFNLILTDILIFNVIIGHSDRKIINGVLKLPGNGKLNLVTFILKIRQNILIWFKMIFSKIIYFNEIKVYDFFEEIIFNI